MSSSTSATSHRRCSRGRASRREAWSYGSSRSNRSPEAVDERTAVVSVSLVQSAEGRVVDLDALRATGACIFLDATQAVGAYPVDLDGIDYLVAHAYKWLLARGGSRSSTSARSGGLEIEPWTAGWKSREDPYEDYYGLPVLTGDARRLDVSLPWFSAAGGRAAWSSSPRSESSGSPPTTSAWPGPSPASSGSPMPSSPIVRLAVDDAEGAALRLQEAGVACSLRGGSVRLSFHLYNDYDGCRAGRHGARGPSPTVVGSRA